MVGVPNDGEACPRGTTRPPGSAVGEPRNPVATDRQAHRALDRALERRGAEHLGAVQRGRRAGDRGDGEHEVAVRRGASGRDAAEERGGGGEAREPVFAALSVRERQVLKLIADGLSNADIALQLQISEKTVRNHASNVFDKLGVWSRAQAIVFARDHGFGG